MALAVGALPPAAARAESPRRSLADCVRVAVQGSGQLAEAEGKVAEWRGRLAEVQSVFYPKISAFAFAAPIFGVKGLANQPDVERQWGVWGPYLRFEGMVMQPLYTFGQASAGEKAATERLAVEEARRDQTRDAVALEVARYYYLHLYVSSMKPSLDSARKLLDEALRSAQAMFDEGSGKVTQTDLQKLKYASAELEKYRVQAEFGHALSLAALKHTMGRPENESLELAETSLPPAPAAEPPPLAELIRQAWERRSEARQLKHGREAALSLEEAERLANYPTLALVGQLVASWSPVRQDQHNTFAYDPYNDLSGGLALAVKFDLDPARANARGDTARAMVDQVDGLARFAQTGIPLDVRRCRDEVDQARRLLSVSEQGATAARKWMLFASAGYAAGTGETKDVLEGLAAFVQAKKGFNDQLLALHMANAQLALSVGSIVDALAGTAGSP
ncbi:MAG: TolC family protein [Deltaproteobacteria bacterium]|nr:TolC family protein [Deltaproteobacteria bacterium]